MAYPVCKKIELGHIRYGVFQLFPAHSLPGQQNESISVDFSIPSRKILSDTRIEICSSTIILGLSGISGRLGLFGGIYSSISFQLLHRSFQPWININHIYIEIQRENTDVKNYLKSLQAILKSQRRQDASNKEGKRFFLFKTSPNYFSVSFSNTF